MKRPNPTILDLATRTQFSYEELEAAAVEYGAHFLQIIAEEASRANMSPLAIVSAILPAIRTQGKLSTLEIDRHWFAEQEFYRRIDHPQRTWQLSDKVHEVLSRSVDEYDYWFSELLRTATPKGGR
jgi:hypothetical protein